MPFGGIGLPEVLIVLVIALLVLGPGKLPDVGAALGKSIREFRKAASDVQEAASLDQAPQASSAATPAGTGTSAPPQAGTPSTSSAVPSETPTDKPA
jgi:sec-independent protein translocase protein TatA